MNETKTFNKLVRDKIPEIIKSHGKTPTTRILSEKEYFIALKEKLEEETNEFQESESLEELADVLEVVFALASHLGSDQRKLEEIRLKKQLERGAFEERTFLLEAELIDNF